MIKVSHMPAWKRRTYMILGLPFFTVSIVVLCLWLAVLQIARLFCSVWDKW